MRVKPPSLFVIAFLFCLFIYFISTSIATSTIDSKEFITRAEFVHLLIRIRELEFHLPEESELFSAEEFYEMEVELLASQGVSTFLGTDGEVNLTRRELAESLYSLIVEKPEEINVAEKISLLVQKGILKKGKVSEQLTKEEVLATLNTPHLAKMIPETYMSPHGFPTRKIISGVSNYPNPVTLKKGITTLIYNLSENAPVWVTIYDLMGYEIKRFEFKAGENGGRKGVNKIIWDCTDFWGEPVMRGGYLCRIVVDSSKGRKVKIRKIGIIP